MLLVMRFTGWITECTCKMNAYVPVPSSMRKISMRDPTARYSVLMHRSKFLLAADL